MQVQWGVLMVLSLSLPWIDFDGMVDVLEL